MLSMRSDASRNSDPPLPQLAPVARAASASIPGHHLFDRNNIFVLTGHKSNREMRTAPLQTKTLCINGQKNQIDKNRDFLSFYRYALNCAYAYTNHDGGQFDSRDPPHDLVKTGEVYAQPTLLRCVTQRSLPSASLISYLFITCSNPPCSTAAGFGPAAAFLR